VSCANDGDEAPKQHNNETDRARTKGKIGAVASGFARMMDFDPASLDVRKGATEIRFPLLQWLIFHP
jgi:hypothetical protein